MGKFIDTKPHQWDWFVKEEIDKEYPSHFIYTVRANPVNLKTQPENEDSPIWEFKPTICEVMFGRTNEERKQSANLIAAAPEMLEALEDVLRILNLNQTNDNLYQRNKISSLISKAKGDEKC